MTNAQKSNYWKCSSCGQEHEEEEDAENCCPNHAEKGRESWVCDECDTMYDTKEEANECCKEEKA